MRQQPPTYVPGPEQPPVAVPTEGESKYSYCALPEIPERVFGPEVRPDRARAIVQAEKKWANGTVLHYYFFDRNTDGEQVTLSNGTQEWRTYVSSSQAEKDLVRKAFQNWKDIGMGLSFKEVTVREEAEIRIGFLRGDGFWSYLGRDVLDYGQNERTMNFGRNLSTYFDGMDTAMHEIGHTLGFPHEHQNPNAGIVWDEPKVYAELAKPPNNWKPEVTYHNIIRKLSGVEGSTWDPNSIMHYAFEAGLIKKPPPYTEGLTPAGGLSALDKQMLGKFYPPLQEQDHPTLQAFRSTPFTLAPAQQVNFHISPEATRFYEFRTLGVSDTVMVLFEEDNGELRYRIADDDSGDDRNAYFRVKLVLGRKYVLRIRMYYQGGSGQTAVVYW